MRFLLFQNTWLYLVFEELWNSKNLNKTPDKTRYSGTERISLKHQIKPGTLEK
jgi:hypothetical protein